MSAGDIPSAVQQLSRGRLEQEQVDYHVKHLSDRCGEAAPTEVSVSTLQSLARRAEHPTQFVKKYTMVSIQKIPQLPGMMKLLEQVAENQEVTAALRAEDEPTTGQENVQPPNASSPDLKTLREKLLKQVVSGTAVKKQKPAKKRTILDERPYLTNNFVISVDPPKEVGPLKNVPVSSQESILVLDLLYCLQGTAGQYIVPVRPAAGDPVAGLQFTVDPTVDKSLQALVRRILPLCGHYSDVVSFTEDSEVSVGRVNQALVAAVELLLQDYRVLVCQLETSWRGGDLSLHQLWFQLQSSLHTLDLLANLLNDITARRATGGATLSILHDRMLHCGGSQKSEKIIQFLIELAAKPFFKTLTTWLHRGVINDVSKDFFVEDHEVLDKSSLPLEYNDDYWEKRYCLRIDKIPTFLRKYADTILRTGKYLNVIQQCDKTAKWDQVNEIRYLTNNEHYGPAIDSAYSVASASLLALIVKDRDLVGHLQSVKNYFLMSQGDFVVQFLDLCEKELSQPVDQVEPARLESLLELALRTSSANSDTYKDNLCVALLPYDLIFQMGKILAYDTAEENEFQTCDTSLLSGMDAFAFGYQVEWPVSLILNHKALAQYQMLFRHLFYCKHVERLLSAVWITNKTTKFLPAESFTVYHLSFGLRQKMLNLIQNLSYYMMVEVIEPAWSELVTAIKTCSTIDDVLTKHSDFLNTCLHDCLLSSPQLLTTVKKLLGVCSEFSDYMQSLGETSPQDFNEDVARYDLQFNSVLFSLLDRISQLGRDNYNEKVLNILHRLDFNSFYTTALDQFKSTPADV
jgi:gamma-tubulin complex component 2